MIDAIITGIIQVLKQEFGCVVYTEEKKQDLKEPCFFLTCLNPSSTLLIGQRYSRKAQFCIQYLPKSRKQPREECYRVAEQLYQCLEFIEIEAENCRIRGTKMKYEVNNDVLHFFVNYDVIVRKRNTEIFRMDELSGKIGVEGEK